MKILAALILTLMIGANTAVYTAAEALILQPLPYPDPDQLVALHETLPDGAEADTSLVALADYQRSSAFSAVAVGRPRSFGLQATDVGAVQVMISGMVTRDWFRVLGAAPVLGRVWTEDEPGVIVLGDSARQRLFGTEANVLGRRVLMNSQPLTVIGVLPPSFGYTWAEQRIDIWIPISRADYGGSRATRSLSAIARLNVPIEQAQAAMNVLAQQSSEKNHGLRLKDLRLEMQGRYHRPIQILSAGALLLTLIACANLAHLLLVRFESRRRELAIRLSLGASLGSLAKGFWRESILISVAGSLGGLALSWVLLHWVPFRVEPDWHALAFAAFSGVLTTLLLPLVPLWKARGLVLENEMREGGAAVAGSRRSPTVRSAVVAAEVAVSVILLAGCLLLARSLQELLQVDPGFATAQVYRFGLGIPEGRYNTEAKMAAFYPKLEAELKAVPGIVDAGVASRLPLSGAGTSPRFNFPGEPPQPSRRSIATAGFFRTLNFRLADGRLFQENEPTNAVIVNQAFVKQHGRGIGQRIEFNWNQRTSATIVGVVSDVRQQGLDSAPQPEIYMNMAQFPSEGMQVVARADRDDPGLPAALSAALARTDSQLQKVTVRPLADWVQTSTGDRRIALAISGGLALVALLLAGIGLYGVIAAVSAQREREMALRSALGASPAAIVNLVLAQGLRLALPGLALGLLGSFLLTGLIRSQLYGVADTDPWMITGVVTGVGLLAVLASLRPALRARHADPARIYK